MLIKIRLEITLLDPTIDSYSIFLDTIPDAALVVDRHGCVVVSNAPAASLFGHATLGQTMLDRLLPADVTERHRQHLAGYWQTPQRRAMGQGGLLHARRHSGELFPVEIMLSPVELAEGRFVVCVVRDKSEQLAREEALSRALANEKRLALSDPLTGIANLRCLRERIRQEIDRSKRNHQPFTLVYLDLDHFKAINDQKGHSEGDRVLQAVASVLSSQFRDVDLAARVGGDEFALLLPETDLHRAKVTIKRCRARLLAAMQDNQWNVGFSIGVACFNQPPGCVDQALGLADRLMYTVKQQGRNHCEFKEAPQRRPL